MARFRRLFIWSAVLSLGLGASRADAVTVDLTPSKDNTLHSESPSNSNGAGPTMFVGRTNNGALRRALIAFNTSSIPVGSTVTNATLTLVVDQNIVGAKNVSLHRVTIDWGEGTSVGGGIGGGQGAPATANDATWNDRFFGVSTWTTPGGDFVATASATASVSATSGPTSWASTAQLVADVQGWVNTPATSFGWLLKGDETNIHSAQRFRSKEFVGSLPKLTVDYTPASSVSDWSLY